MRILLFAASAFEVWFVPLEHSLSTAGGPVSRVPSPAGDRIARAPARIGAMAEADRRPRPQARSPAGGPCAAPPNKIVAENCQPGQPSTEWDVNGSGDPTLQGFATDISVNVGETVFFKVKTDASRYRIDIYRLGYYGGLGARRVATIRPIAALPQHQPECLTDPATRLYDCGNWAVSAAWQVPSEATSGLYIARLVREDDAPGTWRADNSPRPPVERPAPAPHAYGALGYGRLATALKEPRASHIYFVVRDDASRSDLLFQTSDTTWQAYNRYGGTSTYGTFDPARPAPRAYKVSYNRPFETRDYRAVNMPFNAEYPMIRWLEANGYDVTYFTGVDSDRRGALITQHKVFLSVGHDEYWSGVQRRHVEAARDAGVHLAFFSGNNVFWKIRWESSLDGSRTPYRTLVTYKETHANAKIDPLPDVWTGTWRDARPFNPEEPQPENALIGTIFTVNAWRNDPLVVPAEYGRLRFWRHTEVASLKPGERAVLGTGILGHEWNEDLDNGFRPAGLVRLSETTVHNVQYVQDHGSVYDSGTATHHLTLYRAASGALVFSAGTVQWSWGLDAHHDTETGIPPERANPNAIRIGVDLKGPVRALQQATVNLLADMGVRPATLQPGLVWTPASRDRVPPRSRVRVPADGDVIRAGPLVIEGDVQDVEGEVGGVEVSLDGGSRWHPATLQRWTGRATVAGDEGAAGGRASRRGSRFGWRFETVIAPEPARRCILSRAVDDSGNLERAGACTVVTVRRGG